MPKNNFALLAEMVRAKRKELGFSTQELSKRANVSATRINQIENSSPSETTGKVRRPSQDILERLARALGLPAAELLEAAGWLPPQKLTIEVSATNKQKPVYLLFEHYIGTTITNAITDPAILSDIEQVLIKHNYGNKN